MTEINVKKSCPWYRWRSDLQKVADCGGDVEFKAGEGYGTCIVCGKDVPMFYEA